MISLQTSERSSYEELMKKAYMEIPLYSKEWTNLNPSDPGITILENLSAFQIAQQETILSFPDAIAEKLLKMVGITPKPNKCARVLLQAENVPEKCVMPGNQRFMVSNVPYEINNQTEIGTNKLTAVYGTQRGTGETTDYSHILSNEISIGTTVFGQHPVTQNSIYLVFTEPLIPDKWEIFYFTTETNEIRNPIEGNRFVHEFAAINWELYTANGFEKIETRDYTGALICDGEIRFKAPTEPMQIYEGLPKKGYVIRGTLEKADYDLVPKLTGIHAFLFEAWQKETNAVCFTYPKVNEITLFCDLLEEEYIQVFCKEGRDGSYYKYTEADEMPCEGRFYGKQHLGEGIFKFTFDSRRCKSSLAGCQNAIKIVVYSEEMMRQYELGTVYGFDDQKIKLPIANIVPEAFSIIACRKDSKGDEVYDFLRPDRKKEGSMYFTVDETKGEICIRDAGDFIDAKLYLGGAGTTLGEQGNVRKNNEFIPVGYQSEIHFRNPAGGTGGRFRETLAEMKQRFLSDLHRSYVAVKSSDYEELIAEIPELCIHKVRAIADSKSNMVTIAVKPYSDEEFPKLSEMYIKAIEDYLSTRRLLSTTVRIRQPEYVAIEVKGSIFTRQHYENGREQVEKLVREYLDYVKSDKPFGGTIKFDQLFKSIEALDCVDFIAELSLNPQNTRVAVKNGVDIVLAPYCLCYPGNLYIDINTNYV